MLRGQGGQVSRLPGENEIVKETVFRALPIVIGFIAGWIVVYPPPFLGLSFPMRFVIAVPLVALAVFLFFMWMISAAMPEDVEIERVEQRAVTDEMVGLFNAYRAAGFEMAGGPLKVGMMPPAVLLPMIDKQGQMYGTIYRTSTDPPKTSYDIVSMLEPQGGLTTGAAIEGGSLPASPGEFMQIFPGADVQVLRQHHQQALAALERKGLHTKLVSAASFPGDFRDAMNRARAHFWSRPIRHTAIIVYRSVTRTTPHLGPIHKQQVAIDMLRKLREQQVI